MIYHVCNISGYGSPLREKSSGNMYTNKPLASVSTFVFVCTDAGSSPWYKEHYESLTRNVNGPIGKWPADHQAFLILPGVDPTKKAFPVAVNAANQPTIVAGFYGKVGGRKNKYFLH